MDVSPDDPTTWIGAVAASMLAFVGFSTKRQIRAWDKKQEDIEAKAEDHSVRIRTLESNSATKRDVEAIFERINEIGDQSNKQHSQILTLLVERSRDTR